MPQADASLSRESLERDHAALLAQLRSEFFAAGAAAERERIQAVEAQMIPGHEALINTMKFDGKSSAGDAAQAILAAEKQSREKHAAALAGDAPAPLPLVPTPTVDKTASAAAPLSRAELDAKAKAHMAANPGVDYINAVKIIQQQGA